MSFSLWNHNSWFWIVNINTKFRCTIIDVLFKKILNLNAN